MRYLVTARVKPGKEAELLRAIEEGTLGAGSVAGDEYLHNMSDARLCDDGKIKWVEVCFCDVPLDEERPYWETYFDLVRVQDAHARHRCRDVNGTEPWACCECDCTEKLEKRMGTWGTPFLEMLRLLVIRRRHGSSDDGCREAKVPQLPLYAIAVEESMTEKTAKSALTSNQKRVLRDRVNSVPADLRGAFEAAFLAWKKTWFSGGLAISSDPHTRAVGKEFDALISLGPGILPLVVDKLTDPDNFLALQLYDAMQPNERLLVQYGPNDERILEGEQGRARRVLQAWFTNQ